jgi:hypothetical protein
MSNNATLPTLLAELVIHAKHSEESISSYAFGIHDFKYKTISGTLLRPLVISSFDRVVNDERRTMYLIDKQTIFIYDQIKSRYSLCMFSTRKQALLIYDMVSLQMGTNDKIMIL